MPQSTNKKKKSTINNGSTTMNNADCVSAIHSAIESTEEFIKILKDRSLSDRNFITKFQNDILDPKDTNYGALSEWIEATFVTIERLSPTNEILRTQLEQSHNILQGSYDKISNKKPSGLIPYLSFQADKEKADILKYFPIIITTLHTIFSTFLEKSPELNLGFDSNSAIPKNLENLATKIGELTSALPKEPSNFEITFEKHEEIVNSLSKKIDAFMDLANEPHISQAFITKFETEIFAELERLITATVNALENKPALPEAREQLARASAAIKTAINVGKKSILSPTKEKAEIAKQFLTAMQAFKTIFVDNCATVFDLDEDQAKSIPTKSMQGFGVKVIALPAFNIYEIPKPAPAKPSTGSNLLSALSAGFSALTTSTKKPVGKKPSYEPLPDSEKISTIETAQDFNDRVAETTALINKFKSILNNAKTNKGFIESFNKEIFSELKALVNTVVQSCQGQDNEELKTTAKLLPTSLEHLEQQINTGKKFTVFDSSNEKIRQTMATSFCTLAATLETVFTNLSLKFDEPDEEKADSFSIVPTSSRVDLLASLQSAIDQLKQVTHPNINKDNFDVYLSKLIKTINAFRNEILGNTKFYTDPKGFITAFNATIIPDLDALIKAIGNTTLAIENPEFTQSVATVKKSLQTLKSIIENGLKVFGSSATAKIQITNEFCSNLAPNFKKIVEVLSVEFPDNKKVETTEKTARETYLNSFNKAFENLQTSFAALNTPKASADKKSNGASVSDAITTPLGWFAGFATFMGEMLGSDLEETNATPNINEFLETLTHSEKGLANYPHQLKSNADGFDEDIHFILTKCLTETGHAIVYHPAASSMSPIDRTDPVKQKQGIYDYCKGLLGFISEMDGKLRDGCIDPEKFNTADENNKPVVMVMNTTSGKDETTTYKTEAKGNHWIVTILLPAYYQPPFGDKLQNKTPLVITIDPKGVVDLPDDFKEALVNGLVGHRGDESGAVADQQPTGALGKDTQFINNTIAQQQQGSGCAWWATYDALMTVLTGKKPDEFINPDPNQTQEFALRHLLKNHFPTTRVNQSNARVSKNPVAKSRAGSNGKPVPKVSKKIPGAPASVPNELKQPIKLDLSNFTEVGCIGDGNCAFNAVAVSLIALYLQSLKTPNSPLNKFFKTDNFKKFLTKLFSEHQHLIPKIETDPKAAFGAYLDNVPEWNARQRNIAEVLREIAVDLTTANPQVNEGLTNVFHAAFFDYCLSELHIPVPRNLPHDDIIRPLGIFDAKFKEFLNDLKAQIINDKKLFSKKNKKKIKDIDAAIVDLHLTSEQLDALLKKSISLKLTKYWATKGRKLYEKTMRKAGTFAGSEHVTDLGVFFGVNVAIQKSSAGTLVTTGQQITNAPTFVLVHHEDPNNVNSHYNTKVNKEIAEQINKEMHEQTITAPRKLAVSPSETKAATFGFSLRKKSIFRKPTAAVFSQKTSKTSKKGSTQKRPPISDPSTLRGKQYYDQLYHPFTEERNRNFMLSFITLAQSFRALKTTNALFYAMDGENDSSKQEAALKEINSQLAKIRSAILSIKQPVLSNPAKKISSEKLKIVGNFLHTINKKIGEGEDYGHANLSDPILQSRLIQFLKTKEPDPNYNLFDIGQCERQDLFSNPYIDQELLKFLTQNDFEKYDELQLFNLSDDDMVQALEHFSSKLKKQREALECNYLYQGASIDPRLARNNIAFLNRWGEEYTDQELRQKALADLQKLAPELTLDDAIDLMVVYWNQQQTPDRPALGKIIFEQTKLNNALDDLARYKTAQEYWAAKAIFTHYKELTKTAQYQEAHKLIETKAAPPESNQAAQTWLNSLITAEKIYQSKIRYYEDEFAKWEKTLFPPTLEKTPEPALEKTAEFTGTDSGFGGMPSVKSLYGSTFIPAAKNPDPTIEIENKRTEYAPLPIVNPKAITRSPSKLGYQQLPLTKSGASPIPAIPPVPEALVPNLAVITQCQQILNATEQQLAVFEKMLRFDSTTGEFNVNEEDRRAYAEKWQEQLKTLTSDLERSALKTAQINSTATEYLHAQSRSEDFKELAKTLKIVQSYHRHSPNDPDFENLKRTNSTYQYAENFENHLHNLRVTEQSDYLAHPINILATVPAVELAGFSKEHAQQLSDKRRQQEKRLTDIKNLLNFSDLSDEDSDVDDVDDDIDVDVDVDVKKDKTEVDDDTKKDPTSKDEEDKFVSPKVTFELKPKSKKKLKPKVSDGVAIDADNSSKTELAAAKKAAKTWLRMRDIQLQKFEVFVNSQNWVDAKAKRNMIAGTIVLGVATAASIFLFLPTMIILGGALVIEVGFLIEEIARSRVRTNEIKAQQRELFANKSWGAYEIVHKLDSRRKQKIVLGEDEKDKWPERDEGLYILKMLQTEPNYNAAGYRKIVMDSILLRHTGYAEGWNRYTLENPEGNAKPTLTGPQNREGVLSNKNDALHIFKTIINECLASTIQDAPNQYQRVAQLFTHLVNAPTKSNEDLSAIKDCANTGVETLAAHGSEALFTVLGYMQTDDVEKLKKLLNVELRAELFPEKPVAAAKTAKPAAKPPRDSKSPSAGKSPAAPKSVPDDLETLMREIKKTYAAGYKAKDKKLSAHLLQIARDLIQRAFLLCYNKGGEAGAKDFATKCLDDLITNPPASDKKLVIATALEIEFLEKIFPEKSAVLNPDQQVALKSFALNTLLNSEKAGQILGLLATSKDKRSGNSIDKIFGNLTPAPDAKGRDPIVMAQEKSFEKLIIDMFKNSPDKFAARTKGILQKLWEHKNYNDAATESFIANIMHTLTANTDINLQTANNGAKIINALGEFFKEIGKPWLIITSLPTLHWGSLAADLSHQQKLLDAYENSNYGPLLFLYQEAKEQEGKDKEANQKAFPSEQVRKSLEIIYPATGNWFDFRETEPLNASLNAIVPEGFQKPSGKFKTPNQHDAFKIYMEALAHTKQDAYSIQTRYRIISDYLKCLQNPREELQSLHYSKLSDQQKNEIKENIKIWLRDLANHLDALQLAPGVDQKIAAAYVASVLKQLDELDNCANHESSLALLRSVKPGRDAGKLVDWLWHTESAVDRFNNHQSVLDAADVENDAKEEPKDESQAAEKAEQKSKKYITSEQLSSLTPHQHSKRNVDLWQATLNESNLAGENKDKNEKQRIDILNKLLSMIYHGNLQYRTDKKSEFQPAGQLDKPFADWLSQGGRVNILASPEQLQQIWEVLQPHITTTGALNSKQLEADKYFFGSASTHAFKDVTKDGETVVHESKLGLKNPAQLPEYAKNSALVVAANLPLGKAIASHNLHEYDAENPKNLRMNFACGGTGNCNDINGEVIEADGTNGNVLVYFDPKHGIQIGFESCEPNATSIYGHKHLFGAPAKFSFTGDLKLDDKQGRNARKAENGKTDPGKHDCMQIDLRNLNDREFNTYLDAVRAGNINPRDLAKPIRSAEPASEKAAAKPAASESEPAKEKSSAFTEYDAAYYQGLSQYRLSLLLEVFTNDEDKKAVEEKKVVEEKTVAMPEPAEKSTAPVAPGVEAAKKAEEIPTLKTGIAALSDASALRIYLLSAIINKHLAAEKPDMAALEKEIVIFFRDTQRALAEKFDLPNLQRALTEKSDDTNQQRALAEKFEHGKNQLGIVFLNIVKQELLTLAPIFDRQILTVIMNAYGKANEKSPIVIENPVSGKVTPVTSDIANKQLHVFKLFYDLKNEFENLLVKNKINPAYRDTDSGILFYSTLGQSDGSYQFGPLDPESFIQVLNREIASWEKTPSAKEVSKEETDVKPESKWLKKLLDNFLAISTSDETILEAVKDPSKLDLLALDGRKSSKEEEKDEKSAEIPAASNPLQRSEKQKRALALVTRIVSNLIRGSASKETVINIVNAFREYYRTKLATNDEQQQFYNDQIIDLFSNVEKDLPDDKSNIFTWKIIRINSDKDNVYKEETFSTNALVTLLARLIPITTNSTDDLYRLRSGLFALNDRIPNAAVAEKRDKIPRNYTEAAFIRLFYDIFIRDESKIKIILRSLFTAHRMGNDTAENDPIVKPLTRIILKAYYQHLNDLSKADSIKPIFWKSFSDRVAELHKWVKSQDFFNDKVKGLYENVVKELENPENVFVSINELTRFIANLLPSATKQNCSQLTKALLTLNEKIKDEDAATVSEFFKETFAKDPSKVKIILFALFNGENKDLANPLTQIVLTGYCQHLAELPKPNRVQFWKSAPNATFAELNKWVNSEFGKIEQVITFYSDCVEQITPRFNNLFQDAAKSFFSFPGFPNDSDSEAQPLKSEDNPPEPPSIVH